MLRLHRNSKAVSPDRMSESPTAAITLPFNTAPLFYRTCHTTDSNTLPVKSGKLLLEVKD